MIPATSSTSSDWRSRADSTAPHGWVHIHEESSADSWHDTRVHG